MRPGLWNGDWEWDQVSGMETGNETRSLEWRLVMRPGLWNGDWEWDQVSGMETGNETKASLSMAHFVHNYEASS